MLIILIPLLFLALAFLPVEIFERFIKTKPQYHKSFKVTLIVYTFIVNLIISIFTVFVTVKTFSHNILGLIVYGIEFIIFVSIILISFRKEISKINTMTMGIGALNIIFSSIFYYYIFCLNWNQTRWIM